MSRDATSRRLRLCTLVLVAACTAAVGIVVSPTLLDASAPGTYTAPFQAGPKGGDQYNVVNEQPAQGRVSIARAYPFPGAFNCAGQGGFASLRVSPAVPQSTSSVTVHYSAETALDAYSWITLLVRDGSGNWLGGVQRRGPLAGPGALGATLATTMPQGSVITVQFGLQVASACPNVDGGTVQFSSVTLSGAPAAAVVASTGAQPLAAASSLHATAAPRVHAESALTAVAFTFVPGDDDTPSMPVRVVTGSNLLFSNLDVLAPHTVTAVATDAGGAPLFTTADPTPAGATSPVVGVASLAPGVYQFFCRVHTQMRGVLRVLAVNAARGRTAIDSW
jgi:plastocyanin